VDSYLKCCEQIDALCAELGESRLDNPLLPTTSINCMGERCPEWTAMAGQCCVGVGETMEAAVEALRADVAHWIKLNRTIDAVGKTEAA
jgi:hypothetical protein